MEKVEKQEAKTPATPAAAAVTPLKSKGPAKLELVPMNAITESKSNPRKTFGDLADLTASIVAKGVLQPIKVRPLKGGVYEVVYGARRFRASKLAKLEHIPALVQDLSDEEVLEEQMVENLQRADVHELEEAESYDAYIKRYGHSVAQLCAKVGKTKAYIHARWKLCSLTPPLRDAFMKNFFNYSIALLLARVPPALQVDALKSITATYGERKVFAYTDAANAIRDRYMLKIAEAPFTPGDVTLVKTAGACAECPKNTRNQRDLYPEVTGAELCTDLLCYRSKAEAQWERRAAEARSKGQRILTKTEVAKIFTPQGDLVGEGRSWVKLDGYDYSYTNGKPWQQVLRPAIAKGDIGIVLARDAQGEVHELVDRAAAEKVAKALAPKSSTTRSSSGPSKSRSSAPRVDDQVEEIVMAGAVKKIFEAAAKKDIGPAFWRALGAGVAEYAYGSPSGAAILKARGFKSQKGPNPLASLVTLTKPSELPGLVFEMVLGDAVDNCGRHSVAFKTACETYKVDLKQLEAAAKAELAKAAPAKGGAK